MFEALKSAVFVLRNYKLLSDHYDLNVHDAWHKQGDDSSFWLGYRNGFKLALGWDGGAELLKRLVAEGRVDKEARGRERIVVVIEDGTVLKALRLADGGLVTSRGVMDLDGVVPKISYKGLTIYDATYTNKPINPEDLELE
jgi:hypothetical protein